MQAAASCSGPGTCKGGHVFGPQRRLGLWQAWTVLADSHEAPLCCWACCTCSIRQYLLVLLLVLLLPLTVCRNDQRQMVPVIIELAHSKLEEVRTYTSQDHPHVWQASALCYQVTSNAVALLGSQCCSSCSNAFMRLTIVCSTAERLPSLCCVSAFYP